MNNNNTSTGIIHSLLAYIYIYFAVWLISVVDIRLENELRMIDVEINEVIKPGKAS